LSQELKTRGINPSFHASLLRIHIPNDDRRFPGRQVHQLPGFGAVPSEWAVDRILSHSGQGRDAMFEVKWKSGDVTWLQYAEVKHLEAMGICLAAVQVLIQNGSAPQPGCIFNVSVSNKRLSQINSPWRARQGAATCSSSFHMSNDRRYSAQDAIAWEAYDDATIAFVKGEKGHPGPAPPGYKESYMLRHPKAPLPVSVGRAPQLRIIPMLKTAQLRCSNQIIMACACRTTRSVPSFITTRWSTISSGK